jgi:hypothetical protein
MDSLGNLYVTTAASGTVTKISGLVPPPAQTSSSVPALGVSALAALAALLVGAAMLGLRARGLNVS